MPLLGEAAMLLMFDIAKDAICEHDDWHTHEHLPERLSIPGFLRGTRWLSDSGQRYLVLYEVDRLETLASPAYLERLNNPTPWTRRMMPHYRGMSRGLCLVARSCGIGIGHFGLLIRFEPAGDAEASLHQWLGDEVMPSLPARAGLASVHLFRAGRAPEMTSEQRIRGTDARLASALLITGYRQDAISSIEQTDLNRVELERRGATEVVSGIYQAVYTLSARELDA